MPNIDKMSKFLEFYRNLSLICEDFFYPIGKVLQQKISTASILYFWRIQCNNNLEFIILKLDITSQFVNDFILSKEAEKMIDAHIWQNNDCIFFKR